MIESHLLHGCLCPSHRESRREEITDLKEIKSWITFQELGLAIICGLFPIGTFTGAFTSAYTGAPSPLLVRAIEL